VNQLFTVFFILCVLVMDIPGETNYCVLAENISSQILYSHP